ncbi:MAG: GPP34 family phosphoprotein [Gemmatimonadales bacterium]|jgi:hypothetical protein
MNHRGARLTLYEEALLLALRDKKGTIVTGAHYSFALSGAVVGELLLRERITLDDSGKKLMVDLIDRRPTGDDVLDEAVERIANAKRRGSVQTWVQRLARIKRLRHRVALGLVDRGILKADEDKVLLLFTRKIYPERDPRPEREIVKRLRRAIFTYTSELDVRTVMLVALAHHTGLLRATFDKKKLKGRKKRIEQIIEGSAIGDATRAMVQAVQAAAIAASIAATTAATH